MSDGGTQADEATVSAGYAAASAITIWVILLIIAPVWILHSVKTYQDLCTKQRVSVSHRRNKPEINSGYKWITYLSWLSVTLLILSHVGSVTLYFATADLHCDMSWTFIFKFQQFSKTCMYAVFILRLYTIYRTSAYAYSARCIQIFAAIFIIYCVFVTVLAWLVVSAQVFTYDGPSYPNWCAPGADTFLIYGSITLLQDLVVCVGFLIAFLRPLRKTINAVRQHNDSKVTRKIIYAGTKTFIITTTALVSTVICILLAIITGIGLFGACDYVANVFCIVLMTAYYPDPIYYQRLCWPCIKCCSSREAANLKEDDADREEDAQRTSNLEPSTTEKTATNTNTTTSAGSAETATVDTASALRVAATKYNDEYAGVESADRETMESPSPIPTDTEAEVP